nr:50S ribosomal protein L24e [Halomarina salina]
MPSNRTCDYTGEEIEPGTGVMYVKNDGTVLHFVNSKAEKNYLMGREARDLEWTEAGRRARAANRGQQAQQVADEGSTEMDEPEPTSDVAQPDEETATGDEDRQHGSEAGATPDSQSVAETKPEGTTGEEKPGATDELEGSDVETPDEEARGDEDEEPVVDAGGGKEADGTPDLESAEAEAEAEVEGDDEEDDEE